MGVLDTALDMAAWGYSVFPVRVEPDPNRPGKHRKQPLLKAWHIKASHLEEEVEAMPWAQATHVGVNCELSRICVLDIDDPAQRKHLPPLDLTVRQTTISGGEHYWYAAPKFRQGNTTHSPRPGVDIRGVGGFVVWYGLGEWANFREDLAPWPFQRPYGSGTGEDKDEPAHPDAAGAYEPRRVKEGGRNQDLIRAAGWWMRQNPLLDAAWLITALLGHTERWHDPPLALPEVEAVADSAMRWHRNEPDLGGWTAINDLPDAAAPVYLLGKWLVQGSVNLVFSRAGVGKTGVITRMLASLLSGRPLFGWDVPADPYRQNIGWVNGELPPYQFQAQVKSVLAPWGHQVLTIDTRRQNLLDRRSWLLRLAEQVGILVLDTRSSLFRLSDTNSDVAWEPLNDLLRETADMGTAVLLATHAGKPAQGVAQSAFGSSAQEWFMDSIIQLSRPNIGEWMKKDGPWENAKLRGAKRGAAFRIQCDKCRHGIPFNSMLAWWAQNPQGNRIINWEEDNDG